MSKLGLGIVVLTAATLIAGMVYKQIDAQGGDAMAGKAKFEANCQVCHGPQGMGDGPAATALAEIPENLADELNGIFSFDSILISETVMKGEIEEGMPPFEGILSEQDVRDIFAYIRSINE